MKFNPIYRTEGASVDVTWRSAVTTAVYRHVTGRGVGVICLLEGPERNVMICSNQIVSQATVTHTVVDRSTT